MIMPRASALASHATDQNVLAALYDVVMDSYGGALLRGITLEVQAGEAVGIVGPAGSGKSLLLAILAGLVRPTVGDVVFAGQTIDFHARQTPAIAFLPQRAVLDDRLAVWQWLEVVAARHDLPHDLVWQHDPLERLGLTALRHVEIHDLSPLQQRLIDFASLLPLTRALFLLDAPFAGLGQTDAGRMLRCLQAEKERHAGLVLTAGAEADLHGLANRVLYLHSGRLHAAPPAVMDPHEGRSLP